MTQKVIFRSFFLVFVFLSISFYITPTFNISKVGSMSTKPASPVQEYPNDSLEKKVYTLAAHIPTLEPNDQLRLAYCVWAWMVERKGTLQQAVHAAGVRSPLTEEEITTILEKHLQEEGLFDVSAQLKKA